MDAPPADAPRVHLVTRAGCHLCDEARPVAVALARAAGTTVLEIDVDDDDALFERYSDLVPVVLVDGVEVSRWWVEPAALRAALAR